MSDQIGWPGPSVADSLAGLAHGRNHRHPSAKQNKVQPTWAAPGMFRGTHGKGWLARLVPGDRIFVSSIAKIPLVNLKQLSLYNDDRLHLGASYLHRDRPLRH